MYHSTHRVYEKYGTRIRKFEFFPITKNFCNTSIKSSLNHTKGSAALHRSVTIPTTPASVVVMNVLNRRSVVWPSAEGDRRVWAQPFGASCLARLTC